MTITKKTTAAIAALVLTMLGIVAMPKAAYAGTGACSKGWACIWADNTYNGKYYYQSVNEAAVPSTIDNMASSAAANGATCAATRFYDYRNNHTGSYLELNSQTKVGNAYRDPNLSNGGGVSPHAGQNWDNRISRIKFVKCG